MSNSNWFNWFHNFPKPLNLQPKPSPKKKPAKKKKKAAKKKPKVAPTTIEPPKEEVIKTRAH